MARAYYNEFDPHAAAWLRELIADGLIAPGDVDERSIKDVTRDDLFGYRQCHFFAGIGVWSYALRQAGWPDDAHVWTGSCPCQPFSNAGSRKGIDDERHLWPVWFKLIQECGPSIIFGEQVASKDGLGWLDIVQTDLEGMDYACGAAVTAAAGVGAPHRRERLYFSALADAMHTERWTISFNREDGRQRKDDRRQEAQCEPGTRGEIQRLADASGRGRQQEHENRGRSVEGNSAEGIAARHDCSGPSGELGDACLGHMANADSDRRETRGETTEAARHGHTVDADGGRSAAGAVNGFWSDADWILCRDGKWRAVKPGTQPLVDGSARGMVPRRDQVDCTAYGRQIRLRGYGNAIVAQQAQAFIESVMEYLNFEQR